MKKYLISALLLLSLLLTGCDKTTTLINDSISSKEGISLETSGELENEQSVKELFLVIDKEDINLTIEELSVEVECKYCGETREFTQITYKFDATDKEMSLTEINNLVIAFNSLEEIYHQDNYTNIVYPILEVELSNIEYQLGNGSMGSGLYVTIHDDLSIEQYLFYNSDIITTILNRNDIVYKWLKFDLSNELLYLVDYDTLYGDETKLSYHCNNQSGCGDTTEKSIKELVQSILDTFTFFILN